MAATDAKAIPIKNSAYRVTFPILDADGDLVTGATALDSEVSIDAGAFADATAEATEIATASGVYYLDLTAAEMNGDTITVIVKTTSAGAKTTTLVLYTAARSINDLATPTNITAATGIVLSGVTHTGAVIPTVTTTTTATNLTNLPAITANWLTAAGIAAGALDGKGNWNIGKTGYTLTATTGLGNQTADITGSLSGSVGSVTGAVGSVTGAVGSVTGLTSATVHSDLNDIQARLPSALVGGRIDANLGAISTSTTAADNLERSTLGIVTGTVGAASSTTSIVTSALSPAAAVIDQYKGRIVTFDQGTTTANLRGQSTDITANTALGVLTVTALTDAPVSGDTFVIT